MRHTAIAQNKHTPGGSSDTFSFTIFLISRMHGDDAIEAFLTDLSTTRHVSANTQNQALAALLFGINTCSANRPDRTQVWLENDAH